MKAKEVVFREKISCNHTRNENGKMILSTALAEGGVIEYRNGEKGVKLKCGWWMRVVKRDKNAPVAENTKREKYLYGIKPRKISKKERVVLKGLAEDDRKTGGDSLLEYCFKKIFENK